MRILLRCTTQSTQIALAIVLLLDKLKSIEFKHDHVYFMSYYSSTSGLFVENHEELYNVNKTNTIAWKDENPKGLSHVSCKQIFRTTTDRSWEPHFCQIKLYIDNPNYMIIPNRVWQFLVIQNLGRGDGGYL